MTVSGIKNGRSLVPANTCVMHEAVRGWTAVISISPQGLQQEADAAHLKVSQLEARVRQLQVESESEVITII